MADFDAFESAPAAEVDPAADFLAREQNELAGLEDDNFGTSDSQPEAVPSADSLSNESPAAEQIPSDNGLGDFEVVEGGMLDAGMGSGNDADTSNGPSNMYEAISSQDTLRSEPEKIKVWREEQKARLEKKDAEEEQKKNELKEIAKKELDDWYKHHDEQLQKTKEGNRKANAANDIAETQQGGAEEAFVKERDEKVSGQAWEKISKLCEFNPKNSKTTKDVARFRGLLLQLKQTPLVR